MGMTEGWGNNVTRLMSLTPQSESNIIEGIQALILQNEQEHERLYERINARGQRRFGLLVQ